MVVQVCRTSANLLLQNLLLVCCLFGCAYQFYDATREYMAYHMKTLMTRKELRDQELPAFGLCAPIDKKKFNNKTILQRLLESKTVEQILNYCKVLDPETMEYEDCLKETKVREYIDSQHKCYSFFEKEMVIGETPLFGPATREYDIIRLNFSIPAFTPLGPGFAIYPQDEKFTMKRGSHNKVWLLPSIKEEFVFTISIEKTVSLPPPFSTKCFDFRKTKFGTRAVALDDCVLKNFVYKGKHYQPFLSYSNRDNKINDLVVGTIDIETERSLIKDVMGVCDAKLGETDCFSTVYQIIQTSTKPGPKDQTSIKVVLAGLPADIIETVLAPVYSLLDYFNWLGNIANLWFGTHLYGVACLFSDSLVKGLKMLRRKNSMEEEKTDQKEASRETRIIFIIKAFSFALAVYQISDIMDIYFGSPFKWNYFTKLPETVPFPAILICLDRRLDPLKIESMYPEAHNKSRYEDVDDILSLNQQFNVTIEDDELFLFNESFVTWRETMTWDLMHKHFKLQKYFNYEKVCFKTFSPRTRVKKEIPFREYDRTLIEMMQYFQLTVRVMADNYPALHVIVQFDDSLTFSGEGRLQAGSLQNQIFTFNEKEKLQVNNHIIFHRQVKKILCSEHRMADCLPYESKFGMMRYQFIENCIKDKIRDSLSDTKPNAWPRRLFYTNTLRLLNLKEEPKQPFFFSHDDAFLVNATTACETKYPIRDCDESFVETFVESSGFPIQKDKMKVIMYPPGKGYIELTQNLRFSVLGIMAFMGGTIGFWIGFAVIDLRDGLTPILLMMERCFSSRIMSQGNASLRRKKKPFIYEERTIG